VLVISRIGAIEGRFREQMSAEDVVAHVAGLARSIGVHEVVGDQYQAYFLDGAFSRQAVRYVEQPWTSESKTTAVTTLRRWMRDGSILIEQTAEGEALRRELLAFEEKLGPSGVFTYGARRGGHDDRVALLLNIAMSEAGGTLKGSPTARVNQRHEVYRYEAEHGFQVR
jgi:hypothetical protein